MLKYLPELAFSHALQRLRIQLVLLGNSFCPLIICLPDRRLPVTHGGRQNVWKESSSIDQFISLSQTVWQQRTQTSVLTQYFSHPRNPALGNPFADEHTSPVERGDLDQEQYSELHIKMSGKWPLFIYFFPLWTFPWKNRSGSLLGRSDTSFWDEVGERDPTFRAL